MKKYLLIEYKEGNWIKGWTIFKINEDYKLHLICFKPIDSLSNDIKRLKNLNSKLRKKYKDGVYIDEIYLPKDIQKVHYNILTSSEMFEYIL